MIHRARSVSSCSCESCRWTEWRSRGRRRPRHCVAPLTRACPDLLRSGPFRSGRSDANATSSIGRHRGRRWNRRPGPMEERQQAGSKEPSRSILWTWLRGLPAPMATANPAGGRGGPVRRFWTVSATANNRSWHGATDYSRRNQNRPLKTVHLCLLLFSSSLFWCLPLYGMNEMLVVFS